MATYEVHLRDGSTHQVDDVDAYQPERTMTTFFRSNNTRRAIDCWSERVASFRTDELLVVRAAVAERVEGQVEPTRHSGPVVLVSA